MHKFLCDEYGGSRLIACSHFIRSNLSEAGILCQPFTSVVFFLLDELPQQHAIISRPTKLATD